MNGMKSMYCPNVGLDLDGTILNFLVGNQAAKWNHDLIARLSEDGVKCVAVCTNQGGLGFGEKGAIRKDSGMPYPTVYQFLARVESAWLALRTYGILLTDLRVSLFHPRLLQHEIDGVFYEILRAQPGMPEMELHLYRGSLHRKPNYGMLMDVGTLTRFYGDSDDDEGAARAAGIEFHRVERFT